MGIAHGTVLAFEREFLKCYCNLVMRVLYSPQRYNCRVLTWRSACALCWRAKNMQVQFLPASTHFCFSVWPFFTNLIAKNTKIIGKPTVSKRRCASLTCRWTDSSDRNPLLQIKQQNRGFSWRKREGYRRGALTTLFAWERALLFSFSSFFISFWRSLTIFDSATVLSASTVASLRLFSISFSSLASWVWNWKTELKIS